MIIPAQLGPMSYYLGMYAWGLRILSRMTDYLGTYFSVHQTPSITRKRLLPNKAISSWRCIKCLGASAQVVPDQMSPRPRTVPLKLNNNST